jgi:hypothetical protein
MKRLIIAWLLLGVLGIAAAAEEFDALPAAVRGLLDPARGQWPQLDADHRAALVTAAQQWLDMDAAQRSALRKRMQVWDAQSATVRAQRRAPFAAWQRLSAPDQRRVRLSAAAFAQLPLERQQALRAAFSRLPPEQQQGWWLGPGLAPDVIAAGGLFAFVPEGERAALLEVVRDLPPASRMQLAQLSVRMNASQLAALRRELIAAPPAQRSDLIEKALAQ